MFRFYLENYNVTRKTEKLIGIVVHNYSTMTIDEKIRLGLVALSVVSSVAVASHLGVVPHFKIPFLEELGGTGSS